MNDQFRLPGLDPPRQIQPAVDRPEPVLWVRRLAVLRELEPGIEHVVRDVELNRGLNIVWAPPQPSAEGNALFRSGVSGHTAGKTTFCRLLRYALGERTFAAEPIRSRIRQHFPAGWVLAEVAVAGAPWTVARPFAIGAHPFCVQGFGIDAALGDGERLDYQAFQGAAAQAVLSQLPARRFPATDDPIRWEHLLPWLTRDQECRFSDFLEWRHSSSQSEAPALTAEDRQFVVRAVLGLISDEERQEQQTNARLVTTKKEAARREPLLAHQAEVDRQRVGRLLGVDLTVAATELFGSEARDLLEQRKAELDADVARLASSDQRAELQQAVERALEVELNARRDLRDAEGRLAAEKGALDLLEATVRGNSQVGLVAALPSGRDYCNVPMKLAREQQCPLAIGRPADFGEQRGERAAADEAARQRQLVSALSARVDEAQRGLAAAQSATADTRRALLSASTTYEEQRAKILGRSAELTQAERLVENAEAAWEESLQHAAVTKQIDADIEASYARQEQLRARSRQALARFSRTFDYVARALLGDELHGSVDTSGRALTLVIDYLGERDSAALATLKLLAFDLAALTSSIEGAGSFPCLLVHDGPREADMAPEIYERLFLYARGLEQCFAGEPSFQYILTTTTRPPAELLREPWLRLELAGTPADHRLLRVDL